MKVLQSSYFPGWGLSGTNDQVCHSTSGWIWFGSAHQTDAGEVAERDKVNRDNHVWKWECNYLYSYLYNSNIKLNILNTEIFKTSSFKSTL